MKDMYSVVFGENFESGVQVCIMALAKEKRIREVQRFLGQKVGPLITRNSSMAGYPENVNYEGLPEAIE